MDMGGNWRPPLGFPQNNVPNRGNQSSLHFIQDRLRWFFCTGRGGFCRTWGSFYCSTCGQPGHSAEKCPRSQICYRCGQPDHSMEACDYQPRCFKCKTRGHYFYICRNDFRCDACGPDQFSRIFHLCNHCMNSQHFTKDCPNMLVCPICDRRDSYHCHSCYRNGHSAMLCPRTNTCSKCCRPGHTSAECTSRTLCYNCKNLGHSAYTCRHSFMCYECKARGHRFPW
ncbi:cellular nucleic acid-binding protein homolog [Dioscorea cayenensis subsp. rotundata]|uniref:Cellular nucleic acid-binding protein homolog n=1 Tax=Dioscorea cayennensis subsp. rotundata TaxID=55577 RepID=A0AB40D0B8_DIOCR|nr:cellular nucleic acid-binding protein homolog [Dioscorea cayenensis subsp. rotundata]